MIIITIWYYISNDTADAEIWSALTVLNQIHLLAEGSLNYPMKTWDIPVNWITPSNHHWEYSYRLYTLVGTKHSLNDWMKIIINSISRMPIWWSPPTVEMHILIIIIFRNATGIVWYHIWILELSPKFKDENSITFLLMDVLCTAQCHDGV